VFKYEKIDINLHVKSLEKTIEWYKDVLAWESGCDLRNKAGECVFGDVHYSYEPFIGFNLCKSDTNVIPVGFHPLVKIQDSEGLQRLYEHIREKKAEIVSEFSEQPWGKTFRIRDCNGLILEFWSEL
jgi:predicted enzyme related to lactoylglutathione lyase